MLRKYGLIVTLLFMNSCGKDEDEGNSNSDKEILFESQKTVELEILLTGKSLPACNSDNEGKTYYQMSKKNFTYCNGSSWVDLNLSESNGSETTSSSVNSLIRMVEEPTGENCANGGVKLLAGDDLNDNKTIDEEEVISSAFICNGEAGKDSNTDSAGFSTLFATALESSSGNCNSGGVKISQGLDNGDNEEIASNGILESGEVDKTLFVCNGNSSHNSLIKVTNEPSGSNCAAGGKKYEVGLDDGASGTTADDGLLASEEIDYTHYSCTGGSGANGSNGNNSLIRVSSEAAGGNCSAGGQKIETGIDNGDGGGTAGNNALEVGEVDDTNYVCDGPTNFLRVFNSSGTALGYYVSTVTMSGEATYTFYGFIMKHLTQDAYSFYITTDNGGFEESPYKYSYTNRLGGSSGSMSWIYPHYEANDCSGLAYYFNEVNNNYHIAFEASDLLHYKNMRFKFGSSEISFDSQVSDATNRDFTSYLDTTGTCNTITSVNDGGTFLLKIYSTPIFPDNLGTGWYIAP